MPKDIFEQISKLNKKHKKQFFKSMSIIESIAHNLPDCFPDCDIDYKIFFGKNKILMKIEMGD